jgi:hypothetical protein
MKPESPSGPLEDAARNVDIYARADFQGPPGSERGHHSEDTG